MSFVKHHRVKVGAQYATSRRPEFFEETVTTQRYRNNILTTFVQELQDDELQDRFFQHDGATAQTVDSLNFLCEFFDDRGMSLHSVPEYSPRSQTPLDYFLFGHLNNTIFKTPIHTMKRLPIYVYSRMGAISNSFFHQFFQFSTSKS